MAYQNIRSENCKTSKKYTQKTKRIFYLSISFFLLVIISTLLYFTYYSKFNSSKTFKTFTKKIVNKKQKHYTFKTKKIQHKQIINKKNKIHEVFSPAASVINIYNPTNEFYIVVKNFIDYHLALDYAKELLEKNKETVYIIKGQNVFDWNYVAIAKFEQEEKCKQKLDKLNPEYENILKIKYF